MRLGSWILLAIVMASMAGCVSSATIPTVKQGAVQEVAKNETAKPIQFKKIVIKLHRGENIGAVQGGIFCANQAELTYRGGRADISDDDLTEAFRDELEAANYEVVGDPDALFDDPSSWRAEYLVAGLVKTLKANICYPLAGWGNTSEAKGEAYMKVDWQIYSRLDRKVVYELSTEGQGARTTAKDGQDIDIFIDAFAQATRNLLADKKFHDLVTQEPAAQGISTKTPTLVFGRPPYSGPIKDHIDEVTSNVVTVFAGDGHGSGFFVDGKGHLLTNEHVVRTAEKATVRFGDGKEMVAKVLATDARRDVALLVAEGASAPGLPIQSREIKVGETVFAMGSPLDEQFQSTLTKGVVSAFRTEDGYPFIQSDVGVRPGNSGGPLMDEAGNVIGISDLAIVDASGDQTGLNLFIPIGTALREMDITVTTPN